MNLLLYGVAIVIVAFIGYEAAARTNMRRLLRFGLPLYRKTIVVGAAGSFVDHLPKLYDKLNPEVEYPPRSGWLTQVFMQTAVPPVLLFLPVTENALAFRRGYEQRGWLTYEPIKNQLRVIGFFTWPSVFLPIILLFIGLLFPVAFLAIVGYIAMLIYEQRRIYRAMGAIITQEFGNKETK